MDLINETCLMFIKKTFDKYLWRLYLRLFTVKLYNCYLDNEREPNIIKGTKQYTWCIISAFSCQLSRTGRPSVGFVTSVGTVFSTVTAELVQDTCYLATLACEKSIWTFLKRNHKSFVFLFILLHQTFLPYLKE